jgi:hypothetical protein
VARGDVIVWHAMLSTNAACSCVQQFVVAHGLHTSANIAGRNIVTGVHASLPPPTLLPLK